MVPVVGLGVVAGDEVHPVRPHGLPVALQHIITPHYLPSTAKPSYKQCDLLLGAVVLLAVALLELLPGVGVVGVGGSQGGQQQRDEGPGDHHRVWCLVCLVSLVCGVVSGTISGRCSLIIELRQMTRAFSIFLIFIFFSIAIQNKNI